MWSVGDYPPGTPLPVLPTPDLTNFPSWLRPLAAWRWSVMAARHQSWLEEVRQEQFSRSALQPPRLVESWPVKLRGRKRRVAQRQRAEVQAAIVAHWEAQRRDDGSGPAEPG
jgi:hypothetical protein